MNPKLIDADDKKRAKRVPLSAPAFVRMLRSVLPHRRMIAAGILTSIVYALLHSVSIFAALPILRVLLEDEGLHGWADRAMAGKRLDADFILRETPDIAPEDAALIIQSIEPDAVAYLQGLRAGDTLVALDDPPVSPRQWLRRAAADTGSTLAFTARATDGRQTSYEVPAAGVSLRFRVGYRLVSLIPRDPTGSGRMTVLKYVLGTLVVIVTLANLCRFVGEYLVRLGVLRSMMDLRRALYKKVLRLPLSRFTRDTGDMVTRFIQDIQEIQRGLMSLLGKTIREPFKAAFILLWALTLDWRITITMIVIAPLALLLFWRAGASIKKANKKLLRGYGMMMGALTGTLGAINVVKAYTSENAEQRRLWRVDRNMFRHQVKIIRLEAMMSPLIEIAAVAMVSGVTVWLGSRVINREIDIAVFGSLVIALGLLFDPLRKLADVYTRIMRSGAGADRLFELLDAPDETELNPDARELPPLAESIQFDDVTFTYPETDTPALQNVSLTVKRGETVALVGRNGSGKTTLMHLLCGFHRPQEGAIRLDGIDLRDVTVKSLRDQIGLVTQDTVVFPISLRENICYGTRNGHSSKTEPRASARADARVEDAARRAYADEFIREKPDGYDTIPGDMGRTLSGGQKQRIAIARAILRDAPILIFDEATSQIDSESERKIQSAIKDFSRDRTTFIVAHRLSTIRFADRIVVLDAGRIVDTGPHEDLITRCPFYHGLCETQLLT